MNVSTTQATNISWGWNLSWLPALGGFQCKNQTKKTKPKPKQSTKQSKNPQNNPKNFQTLEKKKFNYDYDYDYENPKFHL